MKSWQIQEAKSKFSQVVDLAVAESPQLITRNGKPVAYIVSTGDFEQAKKPSIKQILLNRPEKDLELDIERDRDDFREIRL